jgi:3-phosphoshikimate 1-carboxyvinyltransferase
MQQSRCETSFKVFPSNLKGSIEIPSSKSQTMRAIIFAALAKGKSTIYNYLPSDDTICLIKAIEQMGAKVIVYTDKLEIFGTSSKINLKENSKIFANNSGIILRFLSALFALSEKEFIIYGDASTNKRILHPLINGLLQKGAKVQFLEKFNQAPLKIKGPVLENDNNICIDGSDSQPISALLIMSAFLKSETTIFVKNPSEKAFIDLTLSWFDRLKIKYERISYNVFKILGNSKFLGFEYFVPTDFSTIAFPIAAALVTDSKIILKNIKFDPFQKDSKIIEILQKANANISIIQNTLTIFPSYELKGFSIDVSNMIDALPILCVIGSKAKGETHLYNAKMAKFKESNRIDTIYNELLKLGVKIEKTENGLKIYESKLSNDKNVTLNSYNDHRIALSLIVAGLMLKDKSVTIKNTNCIKKTYFCFYDDFTKKLGAKIAQLQIDQF